MKKPLLAAAAAIIVLSGCGTSNMAPKKEAQSANQVTQEKVTIQLTKNKGKEKVMTKTCAIKTGESVMDVMEKNFSIQTQYNGAFISAINGTAGSAKDKTAWFLSVNGKEAMKGAKDIQLKKGDTVGFDLHNY